MHATPRRRADSDPSLALAKPPWFARTSITHSQPWQQRNPPGIAISVPIKVKETHREFAYKHGSKLHTFAAEDAPWPFSFDREVLEL